MLYDAACPSEIAYKVQLLARDIVGHISATKQDEAKVVDTALMIRVWINKHKEELFKEREQ